MATQANRLDLVTAAAALPVSAVEARMACRIDSDAEDGYIAILIAAATEMLADRGYLGQSLGETAWRAYWDGPVTGALLLPASPLAAANKVTVIKIDAGEGAVAQTLGDFDIVPDKFAPTIEPESGTWPEMMTGAGAVIVEFTAGGATAPAPVRLAILVLVVFWFDSRDGGLGADVPVNIWKTIDDLLVNERRF